MDDPTLRVRESPVGGSRIAWSYLVTLLAGVAAALVTAAAGPLAEGACAAQDSAVCTVGWLVVVGAVALVLALAVAARLARLGWEWWLVMAAVVLGAPLWAVGDLGWGLALPLLLGPGVAALATLTGEGRPRWRPVLVILGSALLMAGTLWVVLGP